MFKVHNRSFAEAVTDDTEAVFGCVVEMLRSCLGSRKVLKGCLEMLRGVEEVFGGAENMFVCVQVFNCAANGAVCRCLEEFGSAEEVFRCVWRS